jgi:hypothetical protein
MQHAIAKSTSLVRLLIFNSSKKSRRQTYGWPKPAAMFADMFVEKKEALQGLREEGLTADSAVPQ